MSLYLLQFVIGTEWHVALLSLARLAMQKITACGKKYNKNAVSIGCDFRWKTGSCRPCSA